MKVKELIEELKKQDQEAEVVISIDLLDNNAQEANAEYVYINKYGDVVIDNMYIKS